MQIGQRFVAIGAILFLAGCGAIVGPLKEASVQPSSQLGIDQPLKISKEDALLIKTLAIFSPLEMIKTDEDKKLYTAELDILISALKESDRFELVSPSKYNRKAEELDLLQDLERLSEEEAKGESAEVALALGADGVLVLGTKNKKANMTSNVGSYLFVGTVSVPLVATLDLISAKDARTAWSQEHEFVFTSGGMTTKNMPSDELKSMMKPVVTPLVDNLLESF